MMEINLFGKGARALSLAVICMSATLTTACSEFVLIVKPIGEQAVDLKDLDFSGQWVANNFDTGNKENESPLLIDIINAAEGELRIVSVEQDGSGQLAATGKLYRSGNNMFINLDEIGPALSPFVNSSIKGKAYIWLPFQLDENTILMWLPKKDYFADLIEEGKLPGVSSGMGLLLGLGDEKEEYNYEVGITESLSSEQLNLFKNDGNAYDWRNPIIFNRVSNSKHEENLNLLN